MRGRDQYYLRIELADDDDRDSLLWEFDTADHY